MMDMCGSLVAKCFTLFTSQSLAVHVCHLVLSGECTVGFRDAFVKTAAC